MTKPTIFLAAALFSAAAGAAPAASVVPDPPSAAQPQPQPQPEATPRLAYGLLMKYGAKLVFAPCRDPSYTLVEDVSPDRQVSRGLEMAGLAEGRKLYVELLGVVEGDSLRASELNLAHADGRCQRPGGSDEAWLARGDQPAWALAAGGERVTLKRQGRADVNLPYRVFERQGEAALFSGQGAEGSLDLRFEHKLCRDEATGVVFGWTAFIRADGQPLRGCAWRR